MPLEVVMRDEIAAAIAGQLAAIIAANEARNVELCRGAGVALRGLAITMRCWDTVQGQVDTGDVLKMLEG